MKPYGLLRKIAFNHRDMHPPKGWRNWWEEKSIVKKRERQSARRQIREELE